MTALIDRRALLASFAAAALAPVAAHAAVPDDRIQRLRRGFNLPDQAPIDPEKRPDRPTLRWLRQRGMTHVRLPLRAEALMARFSDPALVEAALDDFDRALDLLLELDFAVSADIHPGGQFAALYRADPETAFESLDAAWRMLASHIRRRPADRVFAEFLNEPPTEDAVWREQAERLARALRSDLPDTTFVVGPAPYQRVEALAAWRPLDDANVVYAFHYYDPMLFTHQGLTWDASDPLSRLANVPYPAQRGDPRIVHVVEDLARRGDSELVAEFDRALQRPWVKATIEEQFAALSAWSRIYSAPVVLNEFGALRFKAPRTSRLQWLGDVRQAAEAAGFGWAHWDYDGGFGLLDERDKPDTTLIEALLPSQKHASAGAAP